MQNIEIFSFPDENNTNVILITSTEDLYFLIDDIYQSIKKDKGEKFSVLIDLIFRNGYSFNRYCLITFDGKEKYKTMIVNPRQVSDDIKKTIKDFLRNHSEILSRSALSQHAINFITSV